MIWRDEDARERVARTEALLAGLDSLADTASRTQAGDTVAALAALYGECLARVMYHVDRCADGSLAAALASDELVGHLLLVHGLHPVPVAKRVEGALEEVRPVARSHGGDVELLAVEEPLVRLRLRGGCGSCSSSAAALERTVRDAVTQAAPEIEQVEIEGTADRDTGARPATLIPVDALFRDRVPDRR